MDRIVVYLSFDPETDEVYVHAGDEDWEIVILMLEWTLEQLRDCYQPDTPAGTG